MVDTSEAQLDLAEALGAAVKGATSDEWRAGRIVQQRGLLRVLLAPSGLMLEIRPAADKARAYRDVGNFSFAYRSEERFLPKPILHALDQTIEALAAVLDEAGFDPRRDVLLTLEERDVGFPTPYHCAHLDEEVALPQSTIDAYRRDGHVLVRRALNPDVVRAVVPVVSSALERSWPQDQLPVDQRPDAYSQAFTQIIDLGVTNPVVRLFSYMRRILRMAADLMGVSGVRLFCEDYLIKEPGARITPWHQDSTVFPFDAEATITAWIPLRDIAQGEGLLRFARGSHGLRLSELEGINDDSEASYAAIIAEHGLEIDELPPVFLGDVSFHDASLIHGAFGNTGDTHRAILALHCFADGARIKQKPSEQLQRILAGSAPGLGPGALARSDAWPLVFGPETMGPPRVAVVGTDPEATRLRAIVLPEGEPRDLIVERGLLRLVEVSDASDASDNASPDAAPLGYVTSGLVEAHGHISYPQTRGDPVSELRWMNPRRADYAETGVTLIRDMGALDDAICRLMDAPGLPRVHASGTMILRSEVWPFTLTKPEELVRACAERIEAGARWVKVFSDFSDDFQGRIDPGFNESDQVTYAAPILREAVAVVHALGGRMAAHCFTEAGAEVAIIAGVDSLEHGWGINEALLDRMVDQGTAWAPLVGILRVMWEIAAREGYAERHAWHRRTATLLQRMLPMAEARGITLLTGTDQFPAVTVADEARQLHAFGVSRLGALAACSWSGRAYMGEPGLRDGAPADFVLYPRDPREDLMALLELQLISIGGKRVEPSFAKVRPSFEPFFPPSE